VSKRKAIYSSKLKRATHLLFYKRHSKPGVKGWELRKALGSDYPRVLKLLDDHLKALDLQVKTVFEEEKAIENPSLEQLDKARYFRQASRVESRLEYRSVRSLRILNSGRKRAVVPGLANPRRGGSKSADRPGPCQVTTLRTKIQFSRMHADCSPTTTL
jgi:hypothetical protein